MLKKWTFPAQILLISSKLANKLRKVRGLGAAFRYAIPTAHILWLPIEAFSRWGLYPEIWVKPMQFAEVMAVISIVFGIGAVIMLNTQEVAASNPQPA